MTEIKSNALVIAEKDLGENDRVTLGRLKR